MDLSRRGLIARAAAAAGAGLSARLLAPGVVFAGADGEAVFELRVPGGKSPVIETKRTFELLGLDAAAGDAEVRARGLDGRWSDWIPIPAGHDHGPDAERGMRRLTDPVWTGPA